VRSGGLRNSHHCQPSLLLCKLWLGKSSKEIELSEWTVFHFTYPTHRIKYSYLSVIVVPIGWQMLPWISYAISWPRHNGWGQSGERYLELNKKNIYGTGFKPATHTPDFRTMSRHDLIIYYLRYAPTYTGGAVCSVDESVDWLLWCLYLQILAGLCVPCQSFIFEDRSLPPNDVTMKMILCLNIWCRWYFCTLPTATTTHLHSIKYSIRFYKTAKQIIDGS